MELSNSLQKVFASLENRDCFDHVFLSVIFFIFNETPRRLLRIHFAAQNNMNIFANANFGVLPTWLVNWKNLYKKHEKYKKNIRK